MFLWPVLLIGLVSLPLLIWLYQDLLKAPAKSTLLYSDLHLLKVANNHSRRWLRHLPAGTYGLALVLALVALARPTMQVPEALPQAGIMLALDTSRSMSNGDIQPNRFEAAKAAIREFVAALPKGARVGLVTFSGYAITNVPLTTDHSQILHVLDSLYMGRGTAIGEAIVESLKNFPELDETQDQQAATIILLSDGRNRNGIDPLEALEQAKARHVRIHTIGVGSSDFQPQGAGGFGLASRFDEATLRQIAEETEGHYVFVNSAETLHTVYSGLAKLITWHFVKDEATALVALAAALLLVISLALASRRYLIPA